ncbi:unnamed protein product [Brachionus calyciflorus]|uniref:Cytidyltransferase-like domain-containing protein n=1 Tax=Brachionus calyciflorus TaxID=104777 RepID=A0A813PVC0_9BILA|nr:unnamed protein product [Brachionus calyciflorus]
MDHTTVPFELISYRGLLKSVDGIRNRLFSKQSEVANLHEDLKEAKSQNNKSLNNGFFLSVFSLINFIESFLYFLMEGYDNYVYSPLQKVLSPVVRIIPRYISVGSDRNIPIFSANIVTFARTFLVIPIAWYLKYDYNFMAFMCVMFHDFLDHLDGIVAKVQKITYPNHDDPLLGGFLDAFCDKIVNVLSLWTILQITDFDRMSRNESIVYLVICYGVIVYESILGVVRVQDYFLAKFKKDYKLEAPNPVETTETVKSVTAASMEGKLKEKLESMGIAFLCLAIAKSSSSPISSISGIVGIICLLLTLRMAHKSLSVKLVVRNNMEKLNTRRESSIPLSRSTENLLRIISESNQTINPNFETAEMKIVDILNNNISDQNLKYQYRKRKNPVSDEANIDSKSELEKLILEPDFEKKTNKVDKVYTIGCFDLFHHGHVKLINRMRELGKKVIVGVHDSRSIYKLKKRVPVDSTETRMLNVKTVADEVFCIAGCDPSNFMSCIVNLEENETALYVRGDDMPNFPSREVVENLMPIKLLPYTEGVSTTKIRKEKYSHIAPDDEEYLDKIN